MDYTTLLGAWAVAISGPCVISWLAGDLTGAARTRKLYGDDNQAFDGENAAGAFEVKEWAVEGAVQPLSETCLEHRAPLRFAARVEDLALQAERRREERAGDLLSTPAHRVSQPQAALFKSERDAQDAQRVLARYRRSMEELQHINRAREDWAFYDAWPVHEFPSVRIVAPVMLSASASDLHDERVRLSSGWENEALVAHGEL